MIFPGTSVSNSEGSLSKVGPLILVEGAWYGFVPSHNFTGKTNVMQVGTGLLVGNVIRNPVRERHDGYTDIVDAFSVVKFLSYAPIQVSKCQRVRCIDPIELLEVPVWKGEAMGHTAARLVSLDGAFSAKAGEEVQRYMGAFGIVAADDGVTLARVGDAGSSILADHGGRLAGVLLGVSDNTYYCAPAVDLIERHFAGFDSLEIVA